MKNKYFLLIFLFFLFSSLLLYAQGEKSLDKAFDKYGIDNEEAITLFRGAIREGLRKGDRIDAHLYLASLYYEKNLTEKAKDKISQVYKIDLRYSIKDYPFDSLIGRERFKRFVLENWLASLIVEVKDLKRRKTISGAEVKYREIGRTFKRVSGNRITGIPSGNYEVKASAEGYEEKTEIVMRLKAGDIKKVPIFLEETLGKISGKVTEAETSSGIEATISYNGPKSGRVNTDREGRYEIAGLPRGRYSLRPEVKEKDYKWRPVKASQTVKLGPLYERTANFSFEKVIEFGNLYVKIPLDHPNAKVYIDDEFKGLTSQYFYFKKRLEARKSYRVKVEEVRTLRSKEYGILIRPEKTEVVNFE